MSFNVEWTNADALAFRPYTAYASAPVTYSAATDPMSDLQRENAELRELVNILAFCTNDEAHDCDECAINGADTHVTVPEWLFCDSLIERLRTLGFEVTE